MTQYYRTRQYTPLGLRHWKFAVDNAGSGFNLDLGSYIGAIDLQAVVYILHISLSEEFLPLPLWLQTI